METSYPDETEDSQERSQHTLALGDTKAAEPGASVTSPAGLVLLVALFGLLWIKVGVSAVVFVLGIVFMIFLHELGHFMTARWTGMKATRFFVGMGPTIISRTYGETEYGLKAIPAGAFVAISGMHNLDPIPPEDEPRAYKNATYPRRMLVITAGSIMHFIQAIVLFTVLTSVIGIPDLEGDWEISALSQLDDGSLAPAVEAELELGDRIVAIDGNEIVMFEDLREYVSGRAGESVVLSISRDGEIFERETTLISNTLADGSSVGFLGIGAEHESVRQGPFAGLEAFQATFTGSFEVFATIFSPSGLSNLGSLMFDGADEVSVNSAEAAERPVSMVGIVRIAGDEDRDWFSRLALLASMNVFIGIFNLFPLLPLDGGHAAVATYERIRSRKGKRYRVDFAKLLPVTYGVVALLGFLFISTLWLDILRPIS